VFTWFEENDVEYLNCVPPIALLKQFDSAAPLFAPAARGTRLTRLLTQLKWVFTISREGALFDMIGRKRAKGAGRS
jgi:hypothetical protein